MFSVVLTEHIPLEQGLRQGRALNIAKEVILTEHIPLEQGLRLSFSTTAM